MYRLALLVPLLTATLAPADELLDQARIAFQQRNLDEALKLLNQAIQANPRSAAAYDLRGTVHFKLAMIPESLADFDKQIELNPAAAGAHWRRGLTLYYANKFPAGVAQFTTSDRAEPEDVENAIWHFLCNAKVQGIDKARGEFLKVRQDPRGDYMMAIYRMFKGETKPEDVLAIAEKGDDNAEERQVKRFYVNYYVGMYYEALGESKKSLEYLKKAVEKYPIGHYMMDVARVHIKLREKN